MKKIGFITTNRVLAQGFAAAAEHLPNWEFETHLLLDPGQAAVDAEVLLLDAAVIDAADAAPNEVTVLCQTLRQAADCRLLLLVPKAGRGAAIRALENRTVDDFVFYDASLDYLFAKLAAI